MNACVLCMWSRAFRGRPKREEPLIDRIVWLTVNHLTIKKQNKNHYV